MKHRERKRSIKSLPLPLVRAFYHGVAADGQCGPLRESPPEPLADERGNRRGWQQFLYW